MPRDMHSATAAALEESLIRPAWVIFMDIEGDPVLVWTGLGPITFPGTTDPALVDLTFEGIANVGEIGAIVDDRGGSQAVRLALAGVDMEEEALRQVVFNEERWQFRRAYMWIVLLDEDGLPIGEPVRAKTGRMDQMEHTEEDGEGRIEVTVESHQAYASEALNTRWSEQRELDDTDTSQDYVADLANKTPNLQAAEKKSGGFVSILSEAVLTQLGQQSTRRPTTII